MSERKFYRALIAVEIFAEHDSEAIQIARDHAVAMYHQDDFSKSAEARVEFIGECKEGARLATRHVYLDPDLARAFTPDGHSSLLIN